MNEDFTIFVSYSHEDKKIVEEVIHKLTSAGLAIWIDKEIHHGESISSRIVRAIDHAKFILFFSSKNSNVSDYCIGEILVAIHKKKSIIPIKIDSTEYCDDLLVHLIRLHYVNFIEGFSQDEYKELVSVLSGNITSTISGIEIKGTRSPKEKRHVKLLFGLMTVIILSLLSAIIWLSTSPTDEQLIHDALSDNSSKTIPDSVNSYEEGADSSRSKLKIENDSKMGTELQRTNLPNTQNASINGNKFCQDCGVKLDLTAKYCPMCGKKQ